MPAQGTPISGTYLTTGAEQAIGQREDLSDVISRIDPAEVPFYSNAKKEGQTNILNEWQEQLLDAVDNTAQPEGFNAAFVDPIQTTRPGNYAQIFARTWIVSGTLDVVDKAGRDKESSYQKMLKGLELKRDLESSLLLNLAKSGTDPRVLAGFPAWMVNGNFGADVLAAASSGDGVTAAVIAGVSAMTFAIFDGVLEDCYNSGGAPTLMLMTPNAKRQFSGLNDAGDALPAQNRYVRSTPGATAFIGSVSLYVSDFGDLEIAIDRFAQGSSALGGGAATADTTPTPYESTYIIDKRYVSVTALAGRAFLSEPLAKTGDATKGQILYEGTLKVSAHLAHGFVASTTIA